MNTYLAFGLVIASEIEIPEFQIVEARTVDVTIGIGAVPERLSGATHERANWQAKRGAFLSIFEGVGRYLVEDGARITVAPEAGAGGDDLRVILLSSAVAALLQMRGFLTLHASSVATPAGAVLISGKSGYGKSTTLAGFRKRGYKMLSDDITALKLDDQGALVAVPAFGRNRLTEAAAQHYDVAPMNRELVQASVPKYNLPVSELHSGPIRVSNLFLLQLAQQDAPLSIETLSAKDAMPWILKFTFRSNFLKGLGMLSAQFRLGSVLTKQAKTMVISRPREGSTIDEVNELIYTELGL
ncbi:hypothetical protein GCM10007939_20930 [Amylibacter marinus]|uniref:Hpr(Ser) kinase/phosphatase n=1 Tax=Amylibacter marinus TaxID=1475483 RepID=A0ABQ5VWL1_9RHOB|nr:hypothetical protein [Amylibacter marinus]GLQ35810.1 hypothetical protein GCM10007939_20930 [Amylibacter marinus]